MTVTVNSTCAGVTRTGQPCTRWVNGFKYCDWHDTDHPERREHAMIKLKSAQSKGGKLRGWRKRQAIKERSQFERDLQRAQPILVVCERLAREQGRETSAILGEMLEAIETVMREAGSVVDQLKLVPERNAYLRAQRLLRTLPKLDSPRPPDNAHVTEPPTGHSGE